MRVRRQDRIAEEIRKIVSGAITRDVKDPRLGFLTITRVEVSNDLAHATVHVSVLGDASEKATTMRILERVKGHLRREVGDGLQVRVTPELTFKLDESIERGTRVLEIMRSLHADGTDGEE